MPATSQEILTTSEGLKYCTESCFTNSRRASFKRAKTCDWCKHVRRAVSYVDFQDGASQLQFCSDKCLNQYKMQIFCKETQAHLEMNPYLKEKAKISNETLITPELWLKNCRSRSVSPNSENSKSPPDSPNPQKTSASNLSSPTSIKPVISVTPVSKLLNHPIVSATSSRFRLQQKHQNALGETSRHLTKKLRSQRLYPSNISKTKSVHSNIKVRNYLNSISNNSNHVNINPHKVYNVFRNNMGQSSAKNNSTVPISIPKPPIDHRNIQRTEYNLSPRQANSSSASNLLPGYDLRSPVGNFSPLRSAIPTQPPLFQSVASPSTTMTQPSIQNLAELLGLSTPPAALLVPCPILLPFPVPIPIPMPFDVLLKAAELKLNRSKDNARETVVNNNTTQTFSENNISEATETFDEPLDFTKTKSSVYDAEQKIVNDEKNVNDESVNELTKADEKLPKCKIARLNLNRLPNKDLESSRPLRKRKRIIDAN